MPKTMPKTQPDHILPQQVAAIHHVRWLQLLPFITLHLAVLAVFWVSPSPFALAVCVGLYLLRMFAITGFYHRFFAHKTFESGRVVQFIFAFIGASSAQKGPLWWAAHHRHHHRHTDTEHDPHTPNKGFWYSHVLWFMTDEHLKCRKELIKDFSAYPELVWLDKYHLVAPVSLGLLLLGLGHFLALAYPVLGVNAVQLFVWGYVLSTIVLLHATLSINSLAHLFGSRTYPTDDTSRNNFILAILTLGEGWHNNHHFYQGSARQGFRWWQIDISYYLLYAMAKCRLISNLKPVPAKAYQLKAQL